MRNNFILNKMEKVWAYTIPSFDKTGLVKTGFSTRVGPVTKGDRQSTSGFCNALKIHPEDIEFCAQVHGNKVVDIGQEGETRDIDGLITNRQNVALVTFYADCVPLYFLDKKNKVIAISHAGWKGTVSHIGKNTLQSMTQLYGTDPNNCLIAIGPSIGKCCFEVDTPVADRFKEAFHFSDDILEDRGNGKYHIDLAATNHKALLAQGIHKKNIYKSNICTSCNTDILYSYRREGGTASRMAAVIMLI